MDECKAFARNLEAFRKMNQISLSEFSAALDLPKSTLQDVLKNGSASLHTALHIAKRLNVPLSILTDEVILMENEEMLSMFLNCFQWFEILSSEDQKAVSVHIHAIMEVLRK